MAGFLFLEKNQPVMEEFFFVGTIGESRGLVV